MPKEEMNEIDLEIILTLIMAIISILKDYQ
jgi:hypothetical protein